MGIEGIDMGMELDDLKYTSDEMTSYVRSFIQLLRSWHRDYANGAFL